MSERVPRVSAVRASRMVEAAGIDRKSHLLRRVEWKMSIGSAAARDLRTLLVHGQILRLTRLP
jgi:hypothetical protein